MKNKTALLTLLITALFTIMTAACSNPLPLEGTWTTQIVQDDNGMKTTADMSYTFCPENRKGGKATIITNVKLVVDYAGEYSFDISAPADYRISNKDVIMIADTTGMIVNSAFHPSLLISLLGGESLEEFQQELEQRMKDEFANQRDTLFNVFINDNALTCTMGLGTITLIKKE